MSDRLQRWVSIALGAVVFVVVGWMTLESSGRRRPKAELPDSAAPVLQAVASSSAGASLAPLAPPEVDGGVSALLGDTAPRARADEPGAQLPPGAPRTVRLGVVLVQYTGAEGASSTARAKRDAHEHAQALLALAKTDFKKAVHDGDTGSSEDIGRIPRGVLDPRTEAAVFTLAPGEISDALETPKGYWIVKRLE